MDAVSNEPPSRHHDDVESPGGGALFAKSGGRTVETVETSPVETCRSLFAVWRTIVMGNLGARTTIDPAIAGYFFEPAPGGAARPVPLGEVRRRLLGLVDRANLTDDERSAIHLYHGLHGLPLPFSSSKAGPDLAAGRDESTPRETVRAALAKVAAEVRPRPFPGAPERRPTVVPLLMPWFRDLPLSPARRRETAGRAYVRARASCDGPHGPPTLDGLAQWYRDCGLADQDLQRSGSDDHPRPNRNALARAAALMEIALFEEVERLRRLPPSDEVPLRPRASTDPLGRPGSGRLEMVTHPELIALVDGDPSPAGLVAAATLLKTRTLSGESVGGPLALLLRCVRPQVTSLPKSDLERIAAAISYVAVADGNPFLVLEWFGYLMDNVGVTDRTFTLLVNGAEAASEGGYHDLAAGMDRFWARALAQWSIPEHQIPRIEHAEAEQQRLVAAAYRLERLGTWQRHLGDHRRADDSLRRSVQLASRSTAMAERILTDASAFPPVELPGKAGRHGGDLTWPWMLGAILRIVEPLARLDPRRSADVGPPADREMTAFVERTARTVREALQRYEGGFEQSYYRTWYERIENLSLGLAGP